MQRRHAAPAVGRRLEPQPRRRGLARQLDPLGRGHLALQPPLARRGLLGHLLRVALVLGRDGARHRVLRVAGVAARGRDVGLEPPAALVLRLDELLQALPAPGPLVAVGGVAALVALEPLTRTQLDDPRDDRVEEAPVVRDDDQRAVERRQEALEPLEALGVEVVRRLVEQQHVRLAEQRRGQQRAGLLAARQALERRVARQVLDAQAPACVLDPRLRSPAAGRLDALERAPVGLQRVRVRERTKRVPGRARRSAQQVVERAGRRLLRQVAGAHAGGERDRAAVGPLVPGEQAQQRRLAGAVGTDQAHALAGREHQRQAGEQRPGVIALGDVQRFQHGVPFEADPDQRAAQAATRAVLHATARPGEEGGAERAPRPVSFSAVGWLLHCRQGSPRGAARASAANRHAGGGAPAGRRRAA